MNATLTSATALALTLVAGLPATLLAAPAAAAPTTATAHTDIDDFDGDLEPDPKVFIEASATCEPGAGITYAITTHHSPDNATGIEMQWMDENGATAQNLAEHDTVPSGEGVFDVRALLHTTTGFYASDWHQVIVDCDTDLPLLGTPDFTG
ncbi:hypothetical protein RZO50_04420 [Microbacterium sp. SSW1-59]|uniref:hypothetical protein n=1 Tax=Microbacterium xanthum TaxID=3079794 RepID=UPI002AD52D95|nr:hypothetical protein [Microbacterium sp. SSW1-59]MDZ8200742.1 hypothetical protein [Microbacterium sp. SSW1-59]